jgi:riboflavin kinase/FMN adenylyltransferase
MKVFWNLDSARKAIEEPVVTVGNFDGVHRGHQAILEVTIQQAQEQRRPSVVLTFDPHPQKVFNGAEAPPLLTTLSQKIGLFEDLGIAATIVCPFTEEIYRYTAEEFFSEILVGRVHVSHLVEGLDFTFGKGKSGSPHLLKRLGQAYGVIVTIVDPVVHHGEKISSSRVRAGIKKGDVTEARRLLGRPYAVEGQRVPGRGRGRKLGYPTVNIAAENELLPRVGVYAVTCEWEDGVFPGAASLGFNPTFEGDRFSFEVHLIDFRGEIKSNRFRVFFYERLRGEKKFHRVQDLTDQIGRDVLSAREILRYMS